MPEEAWKPNEVCKILFSGLDCLALERGLQKGEVETAKEFAGTYVETEKSCAELFKWLFSDYVKKRTYE